MASLTVFLMAVQVPIQTALRHRRQFRGYEKIIQISAADRGLQNSDDRVGLLLDGGLRPLNPFLPVGTLKDECLHLIFSSPPHASASAALSGRWPAS